MAVFFSRIDTLVKDNALQKFKVRGMLWLVCLLMLTSVVFANDLFPIPSQIEKNVEFWTKIYSQYSTNHVVIHDKDDLSIIYKVVNLNDYYPDSTSLSIKWNVIEDIKTEYRHILQKLAGMSESVNLDSLTREERHVYIVWAQSDDPNKFSKAIYNVRAQLGLRDRFAESIRRSGFYRADIENIFTSYDLPLELTYLPHVESLFNYSAYSKVGAAGVWQFMRSTGRLFMTVNYSVDERLDPIAATDGAAQLLKRNYEELKSWPLAITAYNHGLSGMQTAKYRFHTDDFGVIYENYKSRTFGFASKNFYAEFLAASHVAANYKTYFGEIEPYAPVKYQSIKLQDSYYLKQLVDTFKIHQDTLVAYNPAFRRSVINNQTRVPQGYELRLPYREGFDPREVLVQQTKPVPSYERKSPSLLARAAKLDSTSAYKRANSSATEAYILQKLQTGTTPSLIEREKSTERPPVSLQSN